MGLPADLVRNMSLHLGDEVDPRDLTAAERATLTPSAVPSQPVRAGQRIAMRCGKLSWERRWLAPLMALRHAALGERAAGPPRFLVRVDEFPHATAFDEPHGRHLYLSRRFHETLAEAGVAHLMAVVSQLTHDPYRVRADGGRPLGPEEIELLQRMGGEGVTFAQHGTTHRTRHASPRRRSELSGLSVKETEGVLESGRRRLADIGIHPRVFVPPYNTFDAAQYLVLARRFSVVCAGPESVRHMGFHGGPLWRGGAVYLPCYAPLYSQAKTVLAAAERMIDLAPGTWIPIVLHTTWEQFDDFQALRRLAERIAPFTASWEELLAEVDASARAVQAKVAA